MFTRTIEARDIIENSRARNRAETMKRQSNRLPAGQEPDGARPG